MIGKKKKQMKWMVLCALLLASFGLVVSYVAMYTALSIKETSNVWNVNFTSLKEIKKGNVSTKLPVVNATSMTGLVVNFNNSNDSVTYNFKIKNTGGVDAKLAYINEIEPLCNVNQAVEENVCNSISYEFKYANGGYVTTGDVLKKDSYVDVIFTIRYNGISNVGIRLSNLDIVMVYEQD